MDTALIEQSIFEQLVRYRQFYENFSSLIARWVSYGARSVVNLDSYVYSSMQGTLESICDVLKKGRINDAYSLLRKYYDSVITNVYTNLYFEDSRNVDNHVVNHIDKWASGKDSLPEYRIMSQYIKSSPKLASINNLLYSDKTYTEIRTRCNDHTHYNYFHTLLYNDNEVHLPNRNKLITQFSEDLTAIFILHLAYIFYMKGHYLMSTDYIDAIEYGLTPKDGSEYWVAPFIQEIFDEVIKRNRMDIVMEIKNNTSMGLA